MIDPALVPVVAARFKALADPARLAILSALQGGERNVGELAEATGRSQPNVSQHLAGLARAGFVACRRQGTFAFYRSIDPFVVRICEAVCSGLERRRVESGLFAPGPAARGRRRRP
jgi:DNA-binding transcriptional ArsR family regulator